MNKNQRQILKRLMNVTNDFGGSLDRTSTSNNKLHDRQEAHGKVSSIIYHGILLDHKDNETRDYDLGIAEKLLSELEQLSKKTYPDKTGFLKPEER